MIEAGAYKMKNNPEDMRPSYLRILVDHYTKVAQCDIAKVGSVTWLKVHTSIAKRDHKQRSKLFMTHPYEFYGELPSDSYRSVKGGLLSSIISLDYIKAKLDQDNLLSQITLSFKHMFLKFVLRFNTPPGTHKAKFIILVITFI